MYSERIKKLRETLDLSVAKLSKQIDVAERTIVSYEREGRTPSLDFLAQICKKLNVNPSWFLFGTGEMFNAPQFDAVKTELRQEVLQILKDEGIIK